MVTPRQRPSTPVAPVRGPDASRLASALLDWFGAHSRDLPWRRTSDPYAIWVSEIMLQQTQVRTVIPYWERWMRELPDVTALATADEARVLKLWEGLGYYRRARHLQAAARRMVEVHAGRFPTDTEAIRALPGVGRYTAGAIASIAFGRPEPVLDGNVIRVLTRWHALSGDPKEKRLNALLWERARECVEAAHATGRPSACSHLNQALMELGATVCLPREPRCGSCPVREACRALQQGRPGAFPETAPRPATEKRFYVVLVAEWRGRYRVIRRADSQVNGGLWEFPNREVAGPEVDPASVVGDLLGNGMGELQPWGRVRHAITRYRITQNVFRLSLDRPPTRMPGGGAWHTLEEIRDLALTGAHRKIADRLASNPSGDPTIERRRRGAASMRG